MSGLRSFVPRESLGRRDLRSLPRHHAHLPSPLTMSFLRHQTSANQISLFPRFGYVCRCIAMAPGLHT